MDTLLTFALRYLALLISLTAHEFAHGFAAHMQGDETAEREGRLTLNPLAHIDLMGTVILPLATMAASMGTGGLVPIFGWAKPMPYNPYNLSDHKWGPVRVALSGPICNFGLAALFLASLKILFSHTAMDLNNLLVFFLAQLAVTNIVLGVFNLIPVPPLDGSKLLRALLTHPKHRNLLFTLETKGPQILLWIIILDAFLPVSILGAIFQWAILGSLRLFGLQ